ncbi:DUF4349 domain-containing protein [Bacillus sp. SJS]|uniref:DUF4349 domain-containing protein n=1 Tax=Bacillus sp. SJS TaxID=1423321 RepID=UPI0004DD0F5E|nr:DUF4349 domain-containing protein [Bacillus sp. SJS]KZZ83130.1 hypothetical protein AS29_020310 [Bacillus sp. SJS]
MKAAAALIFLMLILTGCLGGASESKKDSSDTASESSSKSGGKAETEQAASDNKEQALQTPSNRKIIYTADMVIEVKDFDKAYQNIQNEAQSAGGYVVSTNSNVSGEESGLNEGTMTLRIPQEKFSGFLSSMEKGAYKILQKNISGQDVTEEFVDLESRLKAKEAVEARLLEFMKGAGKTEDLLAISKDLSAVQEEIEQLKGRMKYLQNQTDLSTITIQLSETKVVVPGVNNHDLNTWEKTQKQFMNSVNALLYAGSALIIFFAGNLPVWILLLAAGGAVYYFWRKRRSD